MEGRATCESYVVIPNHVSNFLLTGGIWFAGLISPITASLAAIFLTRKLLLQTKCIAAVKAHLRTARKSESAKKMQQVVHIGC